MMKHLLECEESYFLIPKTASWAFQEMFSRFGNLSLHTLKFS